MSHWVLCTKWVSSPQFVNTTSRTEKQATLQFIEEKKRPEMTLSDSFRSDSPEMMELDQGPGFLMPTGAVSLFLVLSGFPQAGIMGPPCAASFHAHSRQRGFLKGHHACTCCCGPARAPHSLGTELSSYQLCLPDPPSWLGSSRSFV